MHADLPSRRFPRKYRNKMPIETGQLPLFTNYNAVAGSVNLKIVSQ